jgi:GalNAc-alpha-(1->4)-GalNAc-alpha-(1->3)-diNAcBac-PP-undecaprenol alpha-1,4-N-acetyl-D-galactosaminyltransferase
LVNGKKVMSTKNILFVIPGMQQGGAERVLSLMANYWAQKNNTVSVITFDNAEPFYSLNDKIKIYKLNSAKNSFGFFNFLVNNIKRTVAYFKYLRNIKPDIIISFTDNADVYCVLYNYFLHYPLIITQRTNPYFNTLPKSIKWLPGLIYRSANAIVIQTAQTVQLYQKLQIKLPPLAAVIYNPLNKDIYSPAVIQQRQNIILAVGRLYNIDKHFDKLIEIFAASSNKNWQLHIAGTGPDLEMLQNKITSLNLLTQVKLLGSIKDLKPLYQQAKIFTTTSEFEGFPNALCEAMANGCACISYNCATGPSEIINNDKNGILVDVGDSIKFTEQLSLLMNDEEKITRFSTEAYKIQTLLDENKIMQQWEQLIDTVLKN